SSIFSPHGLQFGLSFSFIRFPYLAYSPNCRTRSTASRNGFDDLLPGRTVHKEKPKAVDREPKCARYICSDGSLEKFIGLAGSDHSLTCGAILFDSSADQPVFASG